MPHRSFIESFLLRHERPRRRPPGCRKTTGAVRPPVALSFAPREEEHSANACALVAQEAPRKLVDDDQAGEEVAAGRQVLKA